MSAMREHKTPVWERAEVIAHSQLLLGSFRARVGRDLMDCSGHPQGDAKALYEAPFALLSHGTQDDPILNYGNETALRLWEMDFTAFTAMPSRLTAQPMLREERQRLLETAARKGYIDDYAGIRISRTGKLFRIENVILWTITDKVGVSHGQAAFFDRWTPQE